MIGHLHPEQIDEVLRANVIGRLACSEGKKLYVVPITYIYDGKYIIAHSTIGMKIDMMRKNPEVCFQVDELHGPTNWKSVIAWGQYEELTDDQERYAAMQLFVDRMLHLKISETATPPEISERRLHPRSPGNIRPVIYRILVTEKTGRYETESD